MKKVVIHENDPDREIKEYLNTVKPHKRLFGIQEEDMWTIISNVQKYYHEKAERIIAEYKGRMSKLP